MLITKKYITPQEYLDIERKAEFKSEYFNGEMFALAGTTKEHNIISGNIIIALGKRLAEPCQIFHSDLRLNVLSSGLYTYPDIIIVCGEQKFLDNAFDTLLNPTVIFEILSDSAEAYDRGKKFELCRQLDSLKEFVLVSQNHVKVENFVKQSDGKWLLDEEGDIEKTIALPSIDCLLPLKEVYKGLKFN